jgi:hypothetical protein
MNELKAAVLLTAFGLLLLPVLPLVLVLFAMSIALAALEALTKRLAAPADWVLAQFKKNRKAAAEEARAYAARRIPGLIGLLGLMASAATATAADATTAIPALPADPASPLSLGWLLAGLFALATGALVVKQLFTRNPPLSDEFVSRREWNSFLEDQAKRADRYTTLNDKLFAKMENMQAELKGINAAAEIRAHELTEISRKIDRLFYETGKNK